MWMRPLHLHVNEKSDYDDDDIIIIMHKWETGHTPMETYLLTDKICLSYTCSYHFCHIILDSDDWFQVHRGNWQCPLVAMLFTIQLALAISAGHPVTNSFHYFEL